MEPQDWRTRVDQAVLRAQALQPPRYGQPKLTVRLHGGAERLIAMAADARGISPSSFMRRSLLAMTAAVLERDYDDVIAYDNRLQRVGQAAAADPSGRLCGPWQIMELR